MIYKHKLKNAERSVLIDDYVYEWLTTDPVYSHLQFIENLRMHSSGYVFFQKNTRRYDGTYENRTIYLHKLIAERFLADKKTEENSLASFINGDKLDCRVENLIYRSRSTTTRLRKTSNQSGYTGVYPEHNKYRAVIHVEGKSIHLGMFDTPEQAAMAYNQASKKYFGEEGKLNKIRKYR